MELVPKKKQVIENRRDKMAKHVMEEYQEGGDL